MSNKSAGRHMALSIITAIHKRRPMWDGAEYSLGKKARWNLWQEIADEVGGKVHDVRVRWKRLRAYYVNSYKEHVRTGSRPSWQYYNAMSFLDAVMEKALKGEEEDEEAKKATENFDDDSLGLEGFSGWEDKFVLDLPKGEYAPTDQMALIGTALPAQKSQEEKVIKVKIEPINDPESSLDQHAAIAIDDSPGPHIKICRVESGVESPPEASTSYSSNRQANAKAKNEERRKILSDGNDPQPGTSSGSEWLAIERRKLQLLEKEVAEATNPDLSFFKSLLPIMKFFSEPQNLRVRMAINQIILREYKLIRESVVQNGFQVKD